MNGTVAPPSSNSTAATICAGFAAISSAMRCSMVCIISYDDSISEWNETKGASAQPADEHGGAEENFARMAAAIEAVGESRIERAASCRIVRDCTEQLVRMPGAA